MVNLVSNNSLFNPTQHKTIRDVQEGFREIDMAMFPNVKKTLGDHQTFVYTYLGACCAFLDSSELSQMSSDIQRFAKEVVSPTVENCFKAIESHQNDLNKSELKLALLKTLEVVQLHPKKLDFEITTDSPVLKEISAQGLQSFEGTFEFYKVKDTDQKYYGCLITIPSALYAKIVGCFATAGLKDSKDEVGSTASRAGHISVMEPSELAQNYDKVITAHEQHVKAHGTKAQITINGIKKGTPQFGRLSYALMATVAVDVLDQYRTACGLAKMRFAPHLSIFSREIQPNLKLKEASFGDMVKITNSARVSKLSACFEAYQKQQATLKTATVTTSTASATNSGSTTKGCHLPQ